MVATWRSFAHQIATLGGDPVVTKPTGTVDGDLLVATGGNSAGNTITAPAGWNVHAGSLSTAAPLWWKIAASEPANYTFTVPGSGNTIIVISRLDGHDPAAPIDDVDGVITTSTTMVIPAVTSNGANRLLFQQVLKFNAVTFTEPGTSTPRWDASPGGGAASSGADEVVGSGATGTRTWTAASGTGSSVSYMLPIAPVPPKTGTFSGGYAFAGSGFAGAAGPGEGSFVGGYDFSGHSFVGVAGAPSSFGFFNGGYDFSGEGFAGAEPSTDGDPKPGARDRFTARRTPKNRRRSR